MSQGFEPTEVPDFGRQEPRPLDEYGLPAQEVKARRGCLFYGCLTALILTSLLIVAMVVGFFKIRSAFRAYVATYTAPSPVPLPVVNLPEEEQRAVVKRAEDFKKAVENPPANGAGDQPDAEQTLVLTADELNALLEQTPEVRGKFYVRIEGDQIKAQVSLPLNELPGLKGRFLNAEANVDVSMTNDVPSLHLRDVRVKGRPLPGTIRPFIENTDWIANSKTSDGRPIGPMLAETIESIQVKDGKLIVKARKRSVEQSASETIFEWKKGDEGNGHFYELVRTPATWSEAEANARTRTYKNMKGHLATITSAEENALLRDRVAVDVTAWIGLTDTPPQKEDDVPLKPVRSPDGWDWVTWEPVSFVAWAEGEPAPPGASEPGRYAEFIGQFGPKRGRWKSSPNSPEGGRFAIVEYEPVTEPDLSPIR